MLLLLSCSNGTDSAAAGPPRNQATRVVVAEIREQRFIDEVQALGTALANESVEIKSRIPSLITVIAFEEGQFVAKGDLLLELENREIRAQVAVADAELKETQSIYDRNRSLIDTQAISVSNLEQLQAAMHVDEANVEAAKARLANTVIRAPFAGQIGLRRISPGSFVDTQTVITTLDDTRTIKLEFSVPETFVPALSLGMEIAAESLVYPDRLFHGSVSSIDTRLDPVSRSIQVRALIPNEDDVLKPGMFLSVNLKRDRGDVLVAPEEAIVPEGSAQFVFLVNGDTVKQQRVELGRRIPGSVEIVSGVQSGDIVITEGTQKVREGSQVEIVQQRASGEPTTDAGGS